uniref:Uncharacterized protein n=1 Tax=Arundo donax TaxID=35708 RepID=A0A0A9BEL4_ARUDO
MPLYPVELLRDNFWNGLFFFVQLLVALSTSTDGYVVMWHCFTVLILSYHLYFARIGSEQVSDQSETL